MRAGERFLLQSAGGGGYGDPGKRDAAALKRDTKAVAEGLKDGLSSKRSVDLNKAPKDDLTSLPGITTQKADRIIAERPFANTHQLVTRRILSEDEYSQVQDRVVVSR